MNFSYLQLATQSANVRMQLTIYTRFCDRGPIGSSISFQGLTILNVLIFVRNYWNLPI